MEELQTTDVVGTTQEDRRWCVYMHTNKINGKVYIGVAKENPEKRWGKNGRKYNKRQPVFYNAIKKYGWDGFEHSVLQTQLTQNEAWNMEIDLIAKYKSNCCKYQNPSYGYNMTDGGEGRVGGFISEETKELLSKINIERMKNPELRENLRQKAKEQMSDPNMIMLLSSLKQGIYDGDKNPMYGKHHTDDVKQKISEKAKERLKNPKNNGMYGRGRRVVQLTFNNEYVEKYISADEAERITGIDRSSIRKCCHHTVNSAGGFIWLFEEEYYEQDTKQNY